MPRFAIPEIPSSVGASLEELRDLFARKILELNLSLLKIEDEIDASTGVGRQTVLFSSEVDFGNQTIINVDEIVTDEGTSVDLDDVHKHTDGKEPLPIRDNALVLPGPAVRDEHAVQLKQLGEATLFAIGASDVASIRDGEVLSLRTRRGAKGSTGGVLLMGKDQEGKALALAASPRGLRMDSSQTDELLLLVLEELKALRIILEEK
ncbi:MAG: hypothetical protein V3W09_04130 [Nitrososphaerales archaeon]